MNTYFSIMLFVSKLKLFWGSGRGIASITSSSRVKWFVCGVTLNVRVGGLNRQYFRQSVIYYVKQNSRIPLDRLCSGLSPFVIHNNACQ